MSRQSTGPHRIRTSPQDTYGSVQERFRWAVNAGKQVVCPCCQGLAQRYKRSIGSTMALLLIRTYWATREGGWVHIQSRTDAKGGDYAKLRFWGLVEARGDKKQDDSNSSGYWRITDLGSAFVERRIKVYRYVYVYQGQYLGYDPDPRSVVSIDQSLGKRFKYDELMQVSAEPGPAVQS